MINIVISLVLIILIIILIQYQKEKFEVTDYNKDIIMLQEMLKKLKDLKGEIPITLKNADGSEFKNSLIDDLVNKQALIDSVKIEKELKRLFRKLS